MMQFDVRSLSGPARERELKRLVKQLKGCLPALAPQAQRVLVLRAGLGLPHNYSASQVARILRISLTREGVLEDAALLSLQTVAQTDGCDATSAGDQLLSDVALLGPGPSLNAFAPASLAAAGLTASDSTPSRTAATARHTRPAPSPRTAVYKASVAGTPSTGGSSWMLFAFLPLLALGLLAAVGLRGRRGQPRPAVVGHDENSAGVAEATALEAAPSFAWPAAVAQEPEPTAEPEPAAQPEPATALVPAAGNGQAQPPALGEPATSTALATREQAQPSWLKQHGSQVAFLLTALGGAARLLIRTRHSARRRGRHKVG